jgi:hypothetical protein
MGGVKVVGVAAAMGEATVGEAMAAATGEATVGEAMAVEDSEVVKAVAVEAMVEVEKVEATAEEEA